VLRILFFGVLREITACSEIQLEFSGNTEALRQQLLLRWPGLALQTFSMAVNQRISAETLHLKDGDEVALMPPFSGG
jgi:molybdopterin synthase sulfur carrier subunit